MVGGVSDLIQDSNVGNPTLWSGPVQLVIHESMYALSLHVYKYA
jgi:hypothetical protein